MHNPILIYIFAPYKSQKPNTMKTLITKNWNNDKRRVELVIQEITTTVFVKIPDSNGMFWNDQIFTESGENALIKALERAEKHYNIKLIGE